jgi:hypothetical protein
MPPDDPAVKTQITKKSATKIFIERFWADDKIKFSATCLEMPDALDDEDVGTKITLEEYETDDNTKDGIAIWYWENGNKWKEYTFVNGYLDGSYKIFYENGDIRVKGERDTIGDKKEVRIGTWEYYDEDGNKTETIWSE